MAQVEHSRHRTFDNFIINLLGAIAAYCCFPKKPCIRINKTCSRSRLKQCFNGIKTVLKQCLNAISALFYTHFVLHKTSHFVFRDINVAVLANSIHWFASLAGRLKVNVFSLPVHDFPDKFRLAYSSASVNDDELRIFSLQGIIDPFKIVFSVDESLNSILP